MLTKGVDLLHGNAHPHTAARTSAKNWLHNSAALFFDEGLQKLV
jgi:hypothetical protein